MPVYRATLLGCTAAGSFATLVSAVTSVYVVATW